MVEKVEWTALEALACAYCWAEFPCPENKPESPQEYWFGISERARNECRAIAQERMLVEMARGQAVAVPAFDKMTEDQISHVGDLMGLKSSYRIRQIMKAVVKAFRSRYSYDDIYTA